LNIILFGAAGSGKSAFINSCYSVLNSSSEIVGNIAPSGSAIGHCTRKLSRYRLGDISKNEQSSVQIWDTWGVSQSNYSDAFFIGLLQGRIPLNQSMSDILIEKDILSLPSNVQQKPHCVVFFVPASDIVSGSKYLGTVARFADIATQTNIGILYCVTKIDEMTELQQIRGKSKSECCNLLVDIIKKASTAFRCDERFVVPVLNYKTEKARSLSIDVWIFDVLIRSWQEACSKKLLQLDWL